MNRTMTAYQIESDIDIDQVDFGEASDLLVDLRSPGSKPLTVFSVNGFAFVLRFAMCHASSGDGVNRHLTPET